MIAFYHDKNIVMLKLGCILPHLANNCLHKTTDAKIYTFTEGNKELLDKFREDLAGGPSIVFSRKAVVDETSFRKSANICKSIVGVDASQLYSHSMCQVMPTGLCKRLDFDSETSRFVDKTRPAALRRWSCPNSNEQDQNVKLKASLQQADKRKLTASVLMGFVLIATLCLKPWVAFTTSVPARSCVLLSLKRIFNVVARRELDALRGHYVQEKGFKVIEMWECESWRLYKTTNSVKQHIREHFPHRRSLAVEQLLKDIKKTKLIGYVQCDIEVSKNWDQNLIIFLQYSRTP